MLTTMTPSENYQTFIVLVNAFVRKGDKFLLAQRALTELQNPGSWALPGGKVDYDGKYCPEIVLQTLHRELEEEVGVTISDHLEFLCSSLFTRKDSARVVNITFLADYLSGEVRALDDTSAVRWFTLDELKNFAEMEGFLREKVDQLEKFLHNFQNKTHE